MTVPPGTAVVVTGNVAEFESTDVEAEKPLPPN